MKLSESLMQVSLYVGLIYLGLGVLYWFIRVSDTFNRIANDSDKMVKDLHMMNQHQQAQLELQQRLLSIVLEVKPEEIKLLFIPARWRPCSFRNVCCMYSPLSLMPQTVRFRTLPEAIVLNPHFKDHKRL